MASCTPPAEGPSLAERGAAGTRTRAETRSAARNQHPNGLVAGWRTTAGRQTGEGDLLPKQLSTIFMRGTGDMPYSTLAATRRANRQPYGARLPHSASFARRGTACATWWQSTRTRLPLMGMPRAEHRRLRQAPDHRRCGRYVAGRMNQGRMAVGDGISSTIPSYGDVNHRMHLCV